MFISVISISSCFAINIDPIKFGINIELKDKEQAKKWLDDGLDPNFLADKIGTGLMIAAWNNDIEMMELFYKYGADINFENANGEQAILHSAWKGNVEATRWLLSHGAKINRDEDRKWSALHYAAFSGNENVFNFLVENGADINAKSTNGSSVLMMAVYEGKEKIVDKLIALGANKAVKNDWGDGALEWATKFEKFSLAKKVAPTEKDFQEIISRPKESWGKVFKSEKSPVDFENLMYQERILKSEGKDTTSLQRQMAQMQKRYMEEALAKAKLEEQKIKSVSLVVTANRKNPNNQKLEIIKK